MLDAFEGNTAETKTMIPLIRGFVDAHGIVDVIVVADAGMMSEANLKDIEDAGWSFIIAGKLPDIPYQVSKWHTDHPGQAPTDQMILSQKVRTNLAQLRLYGAPIAVDFVAHIRGQVRFGGIDPLIEQINDDVRRCHEILGT